MSTSEPYPGTQAVLRAIALLKAFTDEQPELGLADLARLLELNKTTTYRLLTALESEGMVARNPDTEAYRLGSEAIVIGGRALRSNDLRSVSQAELETLAQAVDEATTLEVLIGHEVLILTEVPAGHLVSSNQSIGTRWPAHATSTGQVLLAHLAPPELEAILRIPLAGYTANTITDSVAFRTELKQVFDQGYAVVDQELEIGFTAVGAPVRDYEGKVVAAISVNGPTARLTPDRVSEIADLVIAAADRISGQLGFKPTEQGSSGAGGQG